MKKFLIFLLTAGLGVLTAQEAGKKTLRIKTVKEIDGKTTVMDTTIHLAPGESATGVLREMGLDVQQGHGEYSFRFESGEGEGKTEDKKTIVIDIEDEAQLDGESMIWHDRDGETEIEVETLENGNHKVTVKKPSSGDEPSVFIMKSDGQNPGKQIIEKDVEVMMIGDGDLSPEDQERIETAIENGNLEEVIEALKAEGKILGDHHRKVEVITLVCNIESIEESDKKVLEEAGLDRKQLLNDLEIKDLSFFPNPNDGRFTLRYTPETEGEVEAVIRDLKGRVIYRNIQSGTGTMIEQEVDISDQPEGVYLLTLTQNGRSLTKKIVMNE